MKYNVRFYRIPIYLANFACKDETCIFLTECNSIS